MRLTWFWLTKTFYFLPAVVLLTIVLIMVKDQFHLLPVSRSFKRHFVFEIAQWNYNKTCEHRNKNNRLECQTCIVKVGYNLIIFVSTYVCIMYVYRNVHVGKRKLNQFHCCCCCLPFLSSSRSSYSLVCFSLNSGTVLERTEIGAWFLLI